jgi:hypothetical protein
MSIASVFWPCVLVEHNLSILPSSGPTSCHSVNVSALQFRANDRTDVHRLSRAPRADCQLRTTEMGADEPNEVVISKRCPSLVTA